CLGYLGDIIRDYFYNYFLHASNLTLDISKNRIKVHSTVSESWRVTLVETGLNTATGGRLKRVKDFIGNQTFMFTYGDGVADINIKELLRFHKKHKKLATVTAVQPLGRFGALDIDKNNLVRKFQEKPKGDNTWINGGFFVLEPKVLDYIEGDETPWEDEPVQRLTKESQLVAYKHYGFWKPFDTLREKIELEMLWNSDKPPWKVWKD
ncbi:MAG: glucose-1-phosphate cytidylyltransferase, partial [Candidatus Omnitrophica bacterium]|nr:glucose-1-phosphate cytidylyltransferase [Candidatus Omnitrophota bacterium]